MKRLLFPLLTIAIALVSLTRADDAKRLSLPAEMPEATAAAAANKPAWVGAPAKLDHGVYRTAVESGRFATIPECNRALDRAMASGVQEYVSDYLGPEAAEQVVLDPAFIRDHICKEVYQEPVQASFGPMHQLHALLEFDDQTRAEINRRWQNVLVGGRIVGLGAATLSVLVTLGAAFSYLKLTPRGE